MRQWSTLTGLGRQIDAERVHMQRPETARVILLG